MSDQKLPGPDPGNSDPSQWTRGMSEEEQKTIRERLRAQFEPAPSDENDFNHDGHPEDEVLPKTEEEQNAEFAEERAAHQAHLDSLDHKHAEGSDA